MMHRQLTVRLKQFNTSTQGASHLENFFGGQMSERDFLIFSFVAAVLLYPVAGAAATLTFFFGVVTRYVK
jgi:hypothetical protein